MEERLGDRIRDGVREIPDVARKGKGCMGGWVGVSCGEIKWEEAREDWEDVKHRKPKGTGLEGLGEGVS